MFRIGPNPEKLQSQFLGDMKEAVGQNRPITPKEEAVKAALEKIGWGERALCWIASWFSGETLDSRVSSAWDKADAARGAAKLEAVHTALVKMGDKTVPRAVLIQNLRQDPAIQKAGLQEADFRKIALAPEATIRKARDWKPEASQKVASLAAPPLKAQKATKQDFEKQGVTEQQAAKHIYSHETDANKAALFKKKLPNFQNRLQKLAATEAEKVPEGWRSFKVVQKKQEEGNEILALFSEEKPDEEAISSRNSRARLFLQGVEGSAALRDEELEDAVHKYTGFCANLVWYWGTQQEAGRIRESSTDKECLDNLINLSMVLEITFSNEVFSLEDWQEQLSPAVLNQHLIVVTLEKRGFSQEQIADFVFTSLPEEEQHRLLLSKLREGQSELEKKIPQEWQSNDVLQAKIEEGLAVNDLQKARAFLGDSDNKIPEEQLDAQCKERLAQCIKLKEARGLIEGAKGFKENFALARLGILRACLLLEISPQMSILELRGRLGELQLEGHLERIAQAKKVELPDIINRFEQVGVSRSDLTKRVIARLKPTDRYNLIYVPYAEKLKENIQGRCTAYKGPSIKADVYNVERANRLIKGLNSKEEEAEARIFLGNQGGTLSQLQEQLHDFLGFAELQMALDNLNSGERDRVEAVVIDAALSRRYGFAPLFAAVQDGISLEQIPNCGSYLGEMESEMEALWVSMTPSPVEKSPGREAQGIINEVKELGLDEVEIKNVLLAKLSPEERVQLEAKDPSSQEVSAAKRVLLRGFSEESLETQIQTVEKAKDLPDRQQKLDLLNAAKNLVEAGPQGDTSKVLEARNLILKAYNVSKNDLSADIRKLQQEVEEEKKQLGPGITDMKRVPIERKIQDLQFKLNALQAAQNLVVDREPRMDQLRLFLGPEQFRDKLEEAFPKNERRALAQYKQFLGAHGRGLSRDRQKTEGKAIAEAMGFSDQNCTLEELIPRLLKQKPAGEVAGAFKAAVDGKKISEELRKSYENFIHSRDVLFKRCKEKFADSKIVQAVVAQMKGKELADWKKKDSSDLGELEKFLGLEKFCSCLDKLLEEDEKVAEAKGRLKALGLDDAAAVSFIVDNVLTDLEKTGFNQNFGVLNAAAKREKLEELVDPFKMGKGLIRLEVVTRFLPIRDVLFKRCKEKFADSKIVQAVVAQMKGKELADWKKKDSSDLGELEKFLGLEKFCSCLDKLLEEDEKVAEAKGRLEALGLDDADVVSFIVDNVLTFLEKTGFNQQFGALNAAAKREKLEELVDPFKMGKGLIRLEAAAELNQFYDGMNEARKTALFSFCFKTLEAADKNLEPWQDFIKIRGIVLENDLVDEKNNFRGPQIRGPQTALSKLPRIVTMTMNPVLLNQIGKLTFDDMLGSAVSRVKDHLEPNYLQDCKEKKGERTIEGVAPALLKQVPEYVFSEYLRGDAPVIIESGGAVKSFPQGFVSDTNQKQLGEFLNFFGGDPALCSRLSHFLTQRMKNLFGVAMLPGELDTRGLAGAIGVTCPVEGTRIVVDSEGKRASCCYLCKPQLKNSREKGVLAERTLVMQISLKKNDEGKWEYEDALFLPPDAGDAKALSEFVAKSEAQSREVKE